MIGGAVAGGVSAAIDGGDILDVAVGALVGGAARSVVCRRLLLCIRPLLVIAIPQQCTQGMR